LRMMQVRPLWTIFPAFTRPSWFGSPGGHRGPPGDRFLLVTRAFLLVSQGQRPGQADPVPLTPLMPLSACAARLSAAWPHRPPRE